MQVGLHSEPQNIWLDAGTRQPDISSLQYEPVAPLSLRQGSQPEVDEYYRLQTLCSALFQELGRSFLW